MHVDQYAFGGITVDGREYDSDLILSRERIVPDWRRRKGHRLKASDLSPILELAPAVLVVGTGATGRLAVSKKAAARLDGMGVRLETMTTDEACARFNELAAAGKDVVAALHLTC